MADLNQKLVTRYAKYHALKSLLEKWLAAQREKIVAGLRSGAKCPDRGPYILELGEAEGRVSWKEEFRKHLLRTLTEAEADAELERIAARERPQEPRLYCKPNPLYRQKFTPRLPAA